VDKDFVQAASMSSSTEIDASKLAGSNSSDKDVKSFAHHMMLDHAKLTLQWKWQRLTAWRCPRTHEERRHPITQLAASNIHAGP
jgi:hypothetical protein